LEAALNSLKLLWILGRKAGYLEDKLDIWKMSWILGREARYLEEASPAST
jgi:hypothetical protein